MTTAARGPDDTARRQFDVPADVAERTLRMFSQQSGRGVIAASEAISSVRTNAVRGELTSAQALERMLLRTGLVATADEATGAFAVRREDPTPANARPTSGAAPSDRLRSSQKPAPQPSGTIALAELPASSSQAAEAGSIGSIYGRVQNVATGQYLNNARVAVKGADHVAFTDQFGTYQLGGMRSGHVVLEVFFTGLDALELPLELAAGATVERNIQLTSVALYGQKSDVVKLDPYRVLAGRETNSQAIATNEQRFAPNIKSVISTDALGPQMIGGAGEFLKTIPGLVVDYDTVDAASVSLRGIAANMTTVMTDGAEMVNANLNSPSRGFQTRNLVLTDIARIEVTKVPLPSKPADSLGGYINLIRKNAFEKDGAEFKFGAILAADTLALTLDKTPRVSMTTDKETYKIGPGFEFSYTQPIGKNFGFVLSGSYGDKYNPQYQSRNTWNSAGTGIGASVQNPYLQNYFYADGDRHQVIQLIGLKTDWRIGRYSTLSAGLGYNDWVIDIGNQQFVPDVGTNGTPTAGGSAFSFGPTISRGATGRGTVTTSHVNITQASIQTTWNVNHRFDNGTWRLESGVNGSLSTYYRNGGNFARRHFGILSSTLAVPVRVTLADINPIGARTIQAFDNADSAVNLYDINRYLVTTAQELVQRNEMNTHSGFADVWRRIEAAPFPLSIQAGAFHRARVLDYRQKTDVYTYNGADRNPATTADQGAAPFAIQGRDNGFGFKNLPFVSASTAYRLWQETPQLFTQTPAQLVAAEITRLTTSEYINEKVTAAYFETEARLFRNRLRLLTGVRYERTDDKGEGSRFDPNAVSVRTAGGAFARDAQGARIRKAEAGAAGSMEELRLTREERAAHSSKSYDGCYPSLHLTYEVTDKFLARLAYAKTYGRPDFVNIIPRTVVIEADLPEGQPADSSVARGTLSTRNPSLQPWTADNYELSVEYYSQAGGMISASVFQKELRNFFGAATRRATAADLEAVGLGPEYVGWDLSTTFNAGGARIGGIELNIRHSLRGVGAWGEHFNVFANATKLQLHGNPGVNFSTFLPKTANWGFSFNRKRLGFTARWNYRGLDRRTPVTGFGPDGYLYYGGRNALDLSLSYQMTRRLAFVGTWNNVFSKHIPWYRYGAETPAYARQWQVQEFGSLFTVGIEGKF